MTFYESTFLAVCEDEKMFSPNEYWGCGTELLIEGVRGIEGAREAAAAKGWEWRRPSAWDDDRRDITLCPECVVKRERRLAECRGEKQDGAR